MTLDKGVGVALVVVMAIVGFFMVQKEVVNLTVNEGGSAEVVEVGAAAGPEHTEHQFFKASAAEGGVFTMATTVSAVTLKDAEIKDARVISVSQGTNAVALTLTTPASTTWSSLPSNGMTQVWIIDNLHTAAGTSTTIGAGTGVDLDGTTANDDVINGGVSGRMECWRLPNTNVRCIVEEMVDAG